MKLSTVLTSTALLSLTSARVLPHEITDLITRDADYSRILPRAGGGKGGGGGGGGGGKGSSSSGSSSSGSGGGVAASGSRGAGSYTNTGITAPAYGRSGAVYSGGSRTPYSAGSASPRGRLPGPLLLGGAGVVGLGGAYYAGYYRDGAYSYNFDDPVTYTNQSAPTSNQTVRADVRCLCRRYNPCSCDDNEDDGDDFIATLIGNGAWQSYDQNRWIATPKPTGSDGVNGTLVIDGSLNNGTGGIGQASAAGFGLNSASERATWGAVAAAVGVAVMVA